MARQMRFGQDQVARGALRALLLVSTMLAPVLQVQAASPITLGQGASSTSVVVSNPRSLPITISQAASPPVGHYDTAPIAGVNIDGLVGQGTVTVTQGPVTQGSLAGQSGVISYSYATGSVTSAASIGGLAGLTPQTSKPHAVTAQMASVSLSTGTAVTVNVPGHSQVGVQINAATIAAQVNQGGVIVASGGRVAMTNKAANAVLGSAINDGGAIQGNSLTTLGAAGAVAP